MGILFLGLAAAAIFFIFIAAVLFVFIPCLIIAIINLVKGKKNHWPRRNVIPLIITGVIDILFILLFILIAIAYFMSRDVPDANTSRSVYDSYQMIFPLL